jgi:hypothetical protein
MENNVKSAGPGQAGCPGNLGLKKPEKFAEAFLRLVVVFLYPIPLK